MADTTITVTIRQPWWLMPYLRVLAFMTRFGYRPDGQQLAGWVADVIVRHSKFH